jgi:predicted nucleic acid-binding protein
MRKVLLDTNILLDFFELHRPEHDIAVNLIYALVARRIEICIAATSLKDVYYILSRHLDETRARQCLQVLLQTMTLLPVDASSCQSALSSGEPDFEDGLILACATVANVALIVSRDRRAFLQSKIPKISSSDLLRQL